MTGVAFAPLLPTWALAALGLAALTGAALRARASWPGALLRLLAGAALLAFLAGPERRAVEGEALADIALVVVDESASMPLGARDAVAADALARLTAAMEARGVEVRRAGLSGTAETDFGEALAAGLAGVPRARLSAVFAVTDGQVTDVPDAGALGLGVPVHAVLTGARTDQTDRRVRTVAAPRYGVVGETARLIFEVVQEDAEGAVPVTVFAGGEAVLTQEVALNVEARLDVPLSAPGETVIEVAVPALPGEMTARNNRAALRLTAIRDRLRVLLVSGEPHAGERVWRNILKSDPAVDLVHFTILKPFEKDAVAPPRELNLIEFPHQELFLEKLDEFDVVIFDRYTYRSVLQPYEFERVAAYVQAGGAVLVAAGPELSGRDSLAAQRSLARILPIGAAGRAVDAAFVPMLSEAGARHPVTAGLDAEPWGRWLRHVPVAARGGTTVLEGPDAAPLLVLSREGEGRVAVLASDHVWLWARGFDGGGPHRELLRRLVHWLMREPALEEEALSGRVGADGALAVTRRSLSADPGPVTVEAPDGTTVTTALTPRGAGLFTGTVRADAPGLYRMRAEGPDGEVFAVAASGEGRVPEWDDVLTTDAALAPLVAATGGAVAALPRAGARLPHLRRVREGADAGGPGWMGLVRRDARAVTAVRTAPLLPRWAWLALALGAAVAAWAAEGRRAR